MASSSEGGKFMEGLMGSTAYAIPELFGFEPPRYVQEFRQDSPIWGFGSQFVGSSFPYIGWYGATKKIKFLREAIEMTGKSKAISNPIMVGAMREGVRWAPFEMGRLGVNTAFGDESFGDMLASNISNMGINMAVGGVGGFIRGAGDRVKTFAEKYPQVDAGQPFQMQIRVLEPEWQGMQPGPEKDTMGRYIMDLVTEARSEKAPTGNYVGPFEKDSFTDYMKPSKSGKLKKEPIFRYQDALFEAEQGNNSKRAFISQKFIADPAHFPDDTSVYNAIGRMGVAPGDFDKYAQFARQVSFRDEAAGQSMLDFYNARYTNIGADWFINKEANEGLYVMGKRFPGATRAQDQWNIFKTGDPDWFRKGNARFLSSVAKDNAWVQVGQQPIGDIGPIGTPFYQMLEQIPYRHLMRSSSVPGRLARTFDDYAALKGLANIKRTIQDSEAIAKLQRFGKQYFMPAEFQTRGSPRGSYLMGMGRALYETAETYSNQAFRGKSGLKENLFLESWNIATKGDRPTHSVGLDALIDDAGQGGVDDFIRIWRENPSAANFHSEYQANKISKETLDLANGLLAEDAATQDHLAKIKMQFEGSHSAGPNQEPGLMPKKWEGEAGVPLYDASGRLRGLALAETGQETQANLQRMLTNHPDWRAGRPFNRAISTPAPVRAALNGKLPNVEGYKYNYSNPTIDEFKKVTLGTHKARTSHEADLLKDYLLGQEMRRLHSEDPFMHQIISERFADMQGQQRPFGVWTNKVADKLLAPVLGQNSATKIGQVANELMFQFQLGGFNLGFIAMNILTPLQTTLPHLMYVFNGTNQIAHDMMRFTPVLRDLKPVGTMGMVDSFKLIGGSIREMANPQPRTLRLINGLVDSGYIEPQYVEEFMGEGATRALDMRKAFSSGGNFISWMRAVSNFGAANSEKFSRMTAAVMSSQAAQKFLGVMDEGQELDIVKALLRHTMYGYKQADRAAIMTTPLGSSFGLFKNWLLNYMFWMHEYSKTAWNGGHLAESVSKGYFKPLLWQQAATLGIGGLAASPLILAAEGMNNLLSDDELMINVYSSMNKQMADGLMYGIPALAQKEGLWGGFALTSQASAPGANPIRDAQFLYTLAMWDRMNYIGKGASAAIDNWMATGEHPMFDSHVQQLFTRALAPRWLYRSMQAIQDEGIASLNTGYPLMKNAGVIDRLMYSFGLTPIEIESQARAADVLYRNQQTKRDLTAATARAFIEAQAAGDYDQTSLIIRGAIIAGLDIDNVMKSVAERMKANNEDQLTRTFKPENAARYRQVLGIEN